MKFHGKNISTMGTGCIQKNGDPTQFLIKMGVKTKCFVCNNVRWKQKIRKIPVLRKPKLGNIFDEAFLFDVSIFSVATQYGLCQT